jgi:hypothetical protein
MAFIRFIPGTKSAPIAQRYTITYSKFIMHPKPLGIIIKISPTSIPYKNHASPHRQEAIRMFLSMYEASRPFRALETVSKGPANDRTLAMIVKVPSILI